MNDETPSTLSSLAWRTASTRFFGISASAVIVLATVLRYLAISRFSLGNDEIQEVRWSTLPFSQLIQATGADGVHPPLEYLVQSLLSRAGAAEWIRRIPSVVAGVLTVGLLVFLGSRWFGRTAGLVSGMLLACSPIHVRFSQEVRPYALGLFLLTASIAALEEYRRTGARWMAVVWFVAVLSSAYTLYFAGLISVLVSLAFIFAYRHSGLTRLWQRVPLFLLSWIGLYLPWLPFVLGVAARQPPVERELLDRSWLRYRLQVLGTGDWRVEPISLGSYAFWFLVVVGIALAWKHRSAAVAVFWLLVGGALQLLILQLRPHFPAVRYFLPSWLAAIVLAGFAIAGLERRSVLRAVGVAAVVLILFFDARTLAAYYDHGRPEWDKVAQYLREISEDDDRVVAANGWTFRNLGYYWNEQGLGRPGVSLERPSLEVIGPSWIIMAVCPMDPEAQGQIESLPLVRAFPMTNHCEIRFVKRGQRLRLPRGICSRDV